MHSCPPNSTWKNIQTEPICLLCDKQSSKILDKFQLDLSDQITKLLDRVISFRSYLEDIKLVVMH